VAADVCKALGSTQTNKAMARVDAADKVYQVVNTTGGPQTMAVVTDRPTFVLGVWETAAATSSR
jgi:prophage antirepressor-like protein